MFENIYTYLMDHLLLPAVFIVAVIVVRPIINRFLKKWDINSHLENWVALYALLVFFLSYYQNSNWLFYPFITLGSIGINLNLLIVSFLIITMAFHISKIFTKQFLPSIYTRYQLDRGVQFTFNRLLHYIIMIVAILMTASAVGINLNSLTVFAGVLGVGIGFGLQNITSNFISGIILLFERPIKIGDRVIVEDIVGDVEQINMRATIIRSINNEHIIVPNSYFLEEHVINRSHGSPYMRLIAPVGVSYDSDPEFVKELLLDVVYSEAKENPSVLLDPSPSVHFDGFGASSLNFDLMVWVTDPKQLRRVKTNLNFRIFKSFKKNGVEIPFPQHDLHLRSVDRDLLEKHLNK